MSPRKYMNAEDVAPVIARYCAEGREPMQPLLSRLRVLAYAGIKHVRDVMRWVPARPSNWYDGVPEQPGHAETGVWVPAPVASVLVSGLDWPVRVGAVLLISTLVDADRYALATAVALAGAKAVLDWASEADLTFRGDRACRLLVSQHGG